MSEYYDEDETFRTCPICKKNMICGPPMDSEEKRRMHLLNGFTYDNFYKHVFQSHSKTALPEGMNDDERHAFIMGTSIKTLEAYNG